MKILGLDLSTHLGYAILDSESGLGACEVKHVKETVTTDHLIGLSEDYHFIYIAEQAGKFVKALVSFQKPDFIFIEQTNLGQSRTDQKLLEFIHYAVLKAIDDAGSSKLVHYVDSSSWRSGLQIKMTKEQRVHNKQVKAGEARGKITPKHLAVAWANATYGLNLLLKDNDKADAICLAHYGMACRNRPQPAPVNVDALFDKS